MPDDDPIIVTEPATAAKVLLPTALMQPHDAVDAAAHQLGDIQIVCGRSLFPETGDTIITEEVRKFPIRK